MVEECQKIADNDQVCFVDEHDLDLGDIQHKYFG